LNPVLIGGGLYVGYKFVGPAAATVFVGVANQSPITFVFDTAVAAIRFVLNIVIELIPELMELVVALLAAIFEGLGDLVREVLDSLGLLQKGTLQIQVGIAQKWNQWLDLNRAGFEAQNSFMATLPYWGEWDSYQTYGITYERYVREAKRLGAIIPPEQMVWKKALLEQVLYSGRRKIDTSAYWWTVLSRGDNGVL
jgi:hypothetical protein